MFPLCVFFFMKPSRCSTTGPCASIYEDFYFCFVGLPLSATACPTHPSLHSSPPAYPHAQKGGTYEAAYKRPCTKGKISCLPKLRTERRGRFDFCVPDSYLVSSALIFYKAQSSLSLFLFGNTSTQLSF